MWATTALSLSKENDEVTSENPTGGVRIDPVAARGGHQPHRGGAAAGGGDAPAGGEFTLALVISAGGPGMSTQQRLDVPRLARRLQSHRRRSVYRLGLQPLWLKLVRWFRA
jgi:hypothetical protein